VTGLVPESRRTAGHGATLIYLEGPDRWHWSFQVASTVGTSRLAAVAGNGRTATALSPSTSIAGSGHAAAGMGLATNNYEARGGRAAAGGRNSGRRTD
jgi:hypothetical protein